MNFDYHMIFGIIAASLMVVGMFPYVRSIAWTRETKPNKSSWIIWSSLGVINLVAYWLSGEKETIWYVAIAAINPTIILGLSLKFGIQEWSKVDTYCILLGITAIVAWILTSNPLLAIIFILTADGIAIIPTYLKIKKDPRSENLLSWCVGLVASIFNVLAIKKLTWANGLYTTYSLVAFAWIVYTLRQGRRNTALPS